MNMNRIAAGALLAVAATAAQAVSFDLTYGPYSTHEVKTSATDFSDIYNFSFAGMAGFLSGALIEYKLGSAIGIDWSDVSAITIYGGWDRTGPVLKTFADPGTAAGAFEIEDLSVPARFSIAVNGRAIGSGISVFQPGIRGSYDLSLAAEPVPEPGALAMMLAGVGLLGFLGMRNKKRD